MNYFKLAVALLASATLLSAAAYPHPFAGFGPVAQPVLPDIGQVQEILEQGDYPQVLAGLFGEQRLPFVPEIRKYFASAMEHGRVESFQFLLSRLQMSQDDGNRFLSHLLLDALARDNFGVAEIIMKHDFPIFTTPRMSVWMPRAEGIPWDLPMMKGFINNHAGKAAEMAPRKYDYKRARSAGDVAVLIELSRHCEAVSAGQRAFDPDLALKGLIANDDIGDGQMAEATRLLLQCGAASMGNKQEFLNMLGPQYAQTKAMIQNFGQERNNQ
jgi:hypothetical protein